MAQTCINESQALIIPAAQYKKTPETGMFGMLKSQRQFCTDNLDNVRIIKQYNERSFSCFISYPEND